MKGHPSLRPYPEDVCQQMSCSQVSSLTFATGADQGYVLITSVQSVDSEHPSSDDIRVFGHDYDTRSALVISLDTRAVTWNSRSVVAFH